jgi:hypothetical protein
MCKYKQLLILGDKISIDQKYTIKVKLKRSTNFNFFEFFL